MRYAVLSDIHGNHIALKAVLEDIKQYKVEKLLVAGDFIGYYYHPDKAFRLLAKWNWQGVQGNHDAMLSEFVFQNKFGMENYRKKYGRALDLAIKKLKHEQVQFILSLPKKLELVLNDKRILLCHGSPWSQDEYVYPDVHKKIFQKISKLNFDFIILGHTHYPLIKKIGKSMIINPGSVGQPRDYGSLASWVFIDFTKPDVSLHRVKFKSRQLIKECQQIDPENPYLQKVLTRDKSDYI